ncbi:HAD family hydrolase [Pseudoalteromonas sp. SSDWG2]|uniref:HAD family hydrolase n=1 Tax=Pseudoalteromonas sp. SSDWG2 TaxID=3139391 RepID=UPI003BAD4C34
MIHSKHTQLRGAIFDMDGTLFSSILDFSRIRDEINCHPSEDILDFVANLDQEEKARAENIILEHELADAHQASFLPRVEQAIYQLHRHDIPMAIVTRNCEQATQIKIARNPLPINVVLTRDDAPPKPDPSALLHIAQLWQMNPSDLIYVGDYRYDIEAAHNAKMRSCLYAPDDLPEYAHSADYVMKCFSELPSIFKLC